MNEERELANGFEDALRHIRAIAGTEAAKGRLFERLMKRYFSEDPLYRDRFANVWLWGEWAAERPDFDGTDTGIDLVAEERDGGHCAIQCKCYAPGTRIDKRTSTPSSRSRPGQHSPRGSWSTPATSGAATRRRPSAG